MLACYGQSKLEILMPNVTRMIVKIVSETCFIPNYFIYWFRKYIYKRIHLIEMIFSLQG